MGKTILFVTFIVIQSIPVNISKIYKSSLDGLLTSVLHQSRRCMDIVQLFYAEKQRRFQSI